MTTDARTLPARIENDDPSVDTLAWLREHRERLERELLGSGAVLLRNFQVDTPARFQEVVAGLDERTLEYNERSSPRTQVLGNIYTSTDYPPQYRIYLHNESSYSSTWPLRLFFCCTIPAATGGETPLADSRRIHERVPAEIRERFARLGVMYVRNFNPHMGLSWSTSFQTDDRATVEERCRQAGIQYEWLSGDRLRTRHVRPAVARHPVTGEWTWFNHATFFHVSTLEPMMRDLLLASYAEADLPNNTYYGDGARIEDDVLTELRRIYEEETVAFPWERGDLLLVENMLVAHGRSSFTGERKVLVAMSQSMDDGRLAEAVAALQ
ncbi:MAG TPA: TauD/TfdA family dioxygenase [Candidatus Dormibacteraeota bacterium]|jgi:alpha-ketoglutarate-dependent taurine dioxygenase